MMQQLEQQYPQYGFGQHKGYGVSAWLCMHLFFMWGLRVPGWVLGAV
jgi:hypothetical protein